MDTPTPAHRARWASIAAELGMTADAEGLLRYAEPCFVVDELRPGRGAIGESRLGGAPDLPPTLAWPTRDDRHLTFVAQIALDELELEWVKDLPRTGWLYFFVGRDEPAWEVAHRVLYFDGPRRDLAPAGTRAIDAASPIEFVAHRLRLRPSFVLDAQAEDVAAIDEAAIERLEATSTQLGGLPVSWDHDPRVDAYLLRSGFAPLLHRTHLQPHHLEREAQSAWADADVERAEELERATELLRAFRADEAAHRERMNRWRVLFLLDSHRDVGMCWWDAGLLQFLVHDDALRARAFDHTYCCVASS